MTDKSLADVAEIMRDMDIAILATRTADGGISGRPMSNNRQVDYDGDSYFFALQDTHVIAEIEAEPNVGLSFSGKSYVYVVVQGRAELIRDKGEFEAHWSPDLDKWYEDGIDTEGLVMIKVHAQRAHIWDKDGEAEVTL